LFYDLTLEDVRACIEHVIRWDMPANTREQAEAQVKGLNEWIAPGGKQDLSWLQKNRIGKVVKAHG
jgi:hypothetical protein